MQVKSGQMNSSIAQTLVLRFNVPNAITMVRVALAIIVAWLLIQGGRPEILLAGILLVIAWATDGLDGFLARKLGQSTLAGALFDLVADRLLMTPILILSIAKGLWWHTSSLMPFNPYPYAAIVIIADLTVLAGIFTFLWKSRSRAIEFPVPTQIARITYSIQIPTLVVGVLGIGPDILIAALMYLTIIFTLIASYSYLKKGGYIFTC
ncbi:CDP-alcohol phosphatidyltransferase family protein [Chloroflexota bacterium]